MSTRLSLEKLSNTRDLGGMRNAGGHTVRPGMLIRSGHLYFAGDNDILTLSDTVSEIVDFRADQERTEKPDPVIPGAANIHIPIVEDLTAGIARDRKSDKAAFALISAGPEAARKYMIRMYENFVTNDFCVSQYRRFVRLLMEPHEKAVLWHCTAGKDRAGFASVIVQEMLGMDHETILADYLQTNRYLEAEIQQLMKMAGAKLGGLDENAKTVLGYAFGAYEEYLDAVYAAARERYGGFDGFIRNGLLIGEDEADRFREKYLQF
ncbi:MAG: tyrosine-protein phosphatase [Lachnospiraceae bacterium]|nr:tyrosine-protein phosphatase [Lachnospiraceae bacterium]